MKAWLLVVGATLLCGCTWVDVSEQGSEVKLLAPEEVADCRRIGRTVSVSLEKVAGIKRNAEKLATELATLARNQAAGMQGNAIVPLGPVTGNERAFGVYSCNN